MIYWAWFLDLLGSNWVLPRRVADLLFGNSSEICNILPLCLMWLLWKHRNNCTFEAWLSETLFDWSHAWGLAKSNTVIDFSESLLFYASFFVILLGYGVIIIVSMKWPILLFIIRKVCAALNILSNLSYDFFCRGYPNFYYAEYISLKRCFFYQLLLREMRKLLVVLRACCRKLGRLYVLIMWFCTLLLCYSKLFLKDFLHSTCLRLVHVISENDAFFLV